MVVSGVTVSSSRFAVLLLYNLAPSRIWPKLSCQVLSSISCTMSARPQSASSAYGDCQLGCKVSAHWQTFSSSEICKLSFKCSAAIPWLNRNLSPHPHTVMDLQVCAPELATASPSAVAGCADKLEFCKVLYVPTGGPAHRCVGEVWVCCCCHGFMFVATSEA